MSSVMCLVISVCTNVPIYSFETTNKNVRKSFLSIIRLPNGELSRAGAGCRLVEPEGEAHSASFYLSLESMSLALS